MGPYQPKFPRYLSCLHAYHIGSRSVYVYPRLVSQSVSIQHTAVVMHSTRYHLSLHFYPSALKGWRGIVITFWAGRRVGGCQTWGTHISVTPWRIFSIRSSVELSRPVVVICPFASYGLAHGPKTCQISTNSVHTLRNAYLWNCWMDLLHLKFHGLVQTCSCATT